MARKTILLVDDSTTGLMTMQMLLDEVSYDILTARDGEEAVDKATTHQPDLILLDILMPKMDGFEACKRLRRGQATKSIPIIMVTMRGEREHMETAYRNGCNDFITKPIDGLEFRTKVRSYLGDGKRSEPGR